MDLASWVADHLRRWSAIRGPPTSGRAVDDGAVAVRVHPPLLAQLVDNLLENACKYSEPGTPIVVRAWREGGRSSLGVEDRGCGLSADESPQSSSRSSAASGPAATGMPGSAWAWPWRGGSPPSSAGTLEVRSGRARAGEPLHPGLPQATAPRHRAAAVAAARIG